MRQEEKLNQKEKNGHLKIHISSAIAWTFLVLFNIIVPLNDSWAKDRLPAWNRNCLRRTNEHQRRAPPFVKEDFTIAHAQAFKARAQPPDNMTLT